MGICNMKCGELYKANNGEYFEILEFLDNRRIKVVFVKTGYVTTSTKQQIMNGQVKDKYLPSVYGIGIVGDGKISVMRKHTQAYQCWKNMLARCYSDKLKNKLPTYADCVVSDEFLNFEIFEEWCKNQIGFGGQDYALDKDLLSRNGKIYSRETCLFVPKEINSFMTENKVNSGVFPVGVSFHKRVKKFSSNISLNNKVTHLGYFDSIECARKAYVDAKNQQAKVLAERYKDKIDIKAYEALVKLNYM